MSISTSGHPNYNEWYEMWTGRYAKFKPIDTSYTFQLQDDSPDLDELLNDLDKLVEKNEYRLMSKEEKQQLREQRRAAKRDKRRLRRKASKLRKQSKSK